MVKNPLQGRKIGFGSALMFMALVWASNALGAIADERIFGGALSRLGAVPPKG